MIDLAEIKKDLESQYQIDCYLFLEDLEHDPSSTLYKTLEPLYQEAYQDKYRFVFFNFSSVQHSTLVHVANVVKYLDISPYFVLVVTNQPDTVDFFSTLPEPIKALDVAGELQRELHHNQTPLFNNSNFMCAHAWVGLHANPDGTTKPCCNYRGLITDNQETPYNIKQHNIKDIVSSNYMRLMRDNFRQGKIPTGCVTCVKNERDSGVSKRSLTPFKLKNIYGNINWESDSVDENLGWIGGHLGNLCNLKCRICSPSYSSTIAAEELKQLENKKDSEVYRTLVNNNWTGDSGPFWTSLKSLVPQIKNFEFLGGEPLLHKENLEFMQWLIDKGYSNDCIFEFVTNGTQYPAIFESIDCFKRFTITVSIDNIEERFELERSGADWITVSNNLEKFVSLGGNNNKVEINISITVNIQNILYLPELINWLRSKKINSYFYNWLTGPDYLSAEQLTPVAKQLVLDKLKSAQLAPEDQEKLNFIINRVKQIKTSDGVEFCKYMQSKDQIRKENFARTHKEIASAMGYVLQ
jgi:sulfatase maturation enzyme AslB (radical SAM superfamily)